jgi:hypothetical protein
MVLTTSWKEEGRIEGRVEERIEGLAEGRQEVSINIALQLLTYKFGALAPEVVERIGALNITQLEALPLAIFGFASATDLDARLSLAHALRQTKVCYHQGGEFEGVYDTSNRG